LAAVRLRAAQTPVAEIEQALSAATLRDPYTDAAFTWDQQRQAIVFHGLEPGERGVHRIEY
jgi:hypothetical protein